MKINLILVLLASSFVLAACGPNKLQTQTITSSTDGVIYGSDSVEELDPTTQTEFGLQGVAAIMDKTDVSLVNQKVLLNDTTVQEKFGTCDKFKLNKQMAAANCTGTLIDPQTILTAKHCVEQVPCESMSVVFGYNKKNASSKETSISPNWVHGCKSVELDTSNDIALVKLDRPSVITPVKIKRKALLEPEKLVGKKVFVFGYALGTPIKKAEGIVRSYDPETGVYKTTLDTFDKNSGSPIFLAHSKSLLGVLVNGEEDFVEDEKNQCLKPKICKETECSGESVIPLAKIGILPKTLVATAVSGTAVAGTAVQRLEKTKK